MDDIIKNREKVILQKFLVAEEERNLKMKIKDDLRRKRMENSIKLEENSKKINEMQDLLVEQYNKNKQKELMRKVKNQTEKLQESIALHRKVIKQLIEQESKIIRKPRNSISKVERLPYIKKARKRFLESVKLSDGEEEEIEVAYPSYIFSPNIKAIKLKSMTPVI
jgi:hypothetical protein